jgi:GT2 family glycosyltransferase
MKTPSLNSDIRVVIISPVRNRRDITLQCLRSLSRVDTEGLWLHKIIIDDGSTDGTSDAIREAFPSVELIQGDGSLWCSGGANLGITEALKYDPKYILLINDDTVFDSKFLRSMVATAEEHERAVVGGLLLLWDEPHKVFQVAPKWDTWFGGWRHYLNQTVWTVPREPFEVELVVGNCTLFPSRAFREEGLFATRWLPHYGDAEFTPRLRKRGWKLLIDPNARIFNQPNDVPEKMAQMSFSQLYAALWKNYNGAHNLRNRFMCYWLGAPSRLQGFFGFVVYVTRLGLQWTGLGRRWADPEIERPLREEYSNS